MNMDAVLVVVCCLAAVALAGGGRNRCSGNGRMVRQFKGRKEDTKMPCKYPALRQLCGDYQVSLTPGNRYLFPKFRLDSLWLGFKAVAGTSAGQWEGRTTNKQAIKYFNGLSDALFTKKKGIATDRVLEFGKDSGSTWAQSKNGDFRVTFVPWDSESKKFKMSSWTFECFADNFTAKGYPRQICGGEDKRETVDRYKELELNGREQVIYYDVFTTAGLMQMNPKCAEATRLMTKECTEEQRREAVRTCSQILSSFKHSKCVSKNTCDPMDVFVDCIDWVCSKYRKDSACERVARGIDMCRTFNKGNLTAKVESAKCYKDFLSIQG